MTSDLGTTDRNVVAGCSSAGIPHTIVLACSKAAHHRPNTVGFVHGTDALVYLVRPDGLAAEPIVQQLAAGLLVLLTRDVGANLGVAKDGVRHRDAVSLLTAETRWSVV